MFLFTGSLDQVKYNYSLEVCSLIFLLIFAVKFFSKRKFPNIINVVFTIAIVCAICDVALDIIASIMVNDINSFPVVATEIVNGLFYCFQALFPALCALYVFTLSEKSLKQEKWHLLLFVPAVIFFFIQLFNPLHHWLFKVEGEVGNLRFVHTDIFIIYYIMCLVYVLLSVIYTAIFRKHFSRNQRVSIYILIGSIIAAIIIQLFIPNVLLTGIAITISIYISIETFADPNHMSDRVSGLLNLSALLYFFKKRRPSDKHKYFLYMKIDKIVNINQAFSIGVGNELYRQIGAFLKSFSKKAWCFRIYNSRFLLLFDSDVDRQRAAYFSEVRFRSPWEANNHTFHLDVQMIKYTNENDDIPIDQLIETFNYAFENLKISSKDVSIIDLDSSTVNKVLRKNEVRHCIEEALKNRKGFSMRYQPIYNVEKKTFDYCEALLRLEDPILGKITPDEFIPIAETAGFAPQIDRWVLEEVCKFTKLVPEMKLFSVNVSGTDFYENPAQDFIEICKKHDVNARKIVYEVTETTAVTHQDNIKSFLDELGQEGSSFAIDDFGTGYSNLSQLNNLNINKVKFDKSLLDEHKLLIALFEMMNKLQVSVVMEGVETKAQFDLVSKAGANYVQGYYFSTPLTEEEFIQFLIDKGIRK